MARIQAAVRPEPGMQGPPGCILGRFFAKSRRNGVDEGQKSTLFDDVGCLGLLRRRLQHSV